MAGITRNTQSTREPEKTVDNSRIRLFDDGRFFEEGYRFLKEELGNERWHSIEKTDKTWLFIAPPELKRRLGAPGVNDSVIFGATAIPDESWPEHDRFQFTADPERVNTAIRAALAMKGQWSNELLLTEQHPVMRWLAERLMMLVPRGEAPLIASPNLQPGELCFCFIGQVSANAGNPLIVDAHAISFGKGGSFRQQPLKEALSRAGFEGLADTGRRGTTSHNVHEGLVTAAVEKSLEYLATLKDARRDLLQPVRDREQKRIAHWKSRRLSKLDETLDDVSTESKRAAQVRNEKDEVERYCTEWLRRWTDAYFDAAPEPTTRLILAIEGV